GSRAATIVGVLTIYFWVLAACGPGQIFEDSSQRATREAERDIYAETIAFVETQAPTLAAMQATAQHAAAMGTQIVQLQAQNRAAEATITAVFAGGGNTVASGPPPPAGQPSGEVSAAALAGNTPIGAVQTSPTPPQAPGATFASATIATGVRQDDGCPLDNVNQFPATEDEIYLVVTARDVAPGTTFYSRWRAPDSQPFDTVSWTPNEPFGEVCIWFFITPGDLAFSPGDWEAQLIVNEQVVIRQPFTIQGDPNNSAPTP
ncbi:MAG: hypothetical protein ACLFTK_16950, partial [Anaerolineales bacterium]